MQGCGEVESDFARFDCSLKDQALLSLELMSKGKMYKASADASEASQDKEQKCDSLGKPSEDANGAPLCDL